MKRAHRKKRRYRADEWRYAAKAAFLVALSVSLKAAAPADDSSTPVAIIITYGEIDRPYRLALPIESQGSGMVLGGGRYLLTAKHVLHHCLTPASRRTGSYRKLCDPTNPSIRDRFYLLSRKPKLRITLNEVNLNAEIVYPKSFGERIGAVADQTLAEDFALLRVTAPPVENIATASQTLCSQFVYTEDSADAAVRAVGYTRDKSIRISEGAFLGVDENGSIVTTAAVGNGMSGGPVFNREGGVIGIIRARNDEAGVSFVTPAPPIVERLKTDFPEIETVSCRIALRAEDRAPRDAPASSENFP